MIRSIEWLGDRVRFLDQTALPRQECYVETSDYHVIAEGIRCLKLRGAPLIGIAASYGVALAAVAFHGTDFDKLSNIVRAASAELSSTRPTAVNLFWALERMHNVFAACDSVGAAQRALVEEATGIHKADARMCEKIGEHGAALVPDPAAILTHCNTGALATGGGGTAQSLITTAHRQGKSIKVFAGETRPLLQGARLTAWELQKSGIDTTLITDSTGPVLMSMGKIDLVVVGADRIAANGDTANKIGTYNLAVTAHHHRVPFYVAAPGSTIDRSLASGAKIIIEERSSKELTEMFGQQLAPRGISTFTPAFDVTPASLITAIVTETGVHRPPYRFEK
ncbi:MAG TPA: S-methyl-5-thioribose-1-phosphate isomerase [Bacteroidota bacterium]|jgi:methylthioribose-1-phosphate isomerase|nr:S-methyl-5-thioribose-1-phosphate isomerase [Bacteroidota bacterium]